MTVTTKTNKRGGTVTTKTRKNGSTVKTVTGKNGGTRKVTTGKSGGKKVVRSKDGKVVGGKTTNKKGKVTSITKKTKSGETKTLNKNSARVGVANRIANGKGKNAKAMQDLKAKKKAARKSGDTEKLTALRKKSAATRRTMVKNTKARRAAKGSES